MGRYTSAILVTSLLYDRVFAVSQNYVPHEVSTSQLLFDPGKPQPVIRVGPTATPCAV